MKEVDLRDAARRFSTAVIAREVLSDVANVLGAQGVDVMPLKGVVLHRLVYADALDRPLKDVDVAVRSRDFDAARDALGRAGYSVVREEPGAYEVALRSERFPLSVDLHRYFAAARRFRLTPDAMFARGRRDETLFGFSVILPDDYDLYAHLLAHAVLDFVAGVGWHRPDDLALLARVRDLSPEECARRLDEHGLGRFARLALASGTPIGNHAHSAEILSCLRADPMGGLIAWAARGIYRRDRSPMLLRRAAAVLLNPTLTEAGVALVEAMARRARVSLPR